MSLPYDSKIVQVSGDYYLAQGYDSDSEIQMYRSLDSLFEFEIDEIGDMLEDDYY